MSDAIDELRRQHQAGQQKYTYFLLAAAGACIAYAMEMAIGVPLNCSLSFLSLAVLSWGLSFYFGCKTAATIQALIRANVNLLSLYKRSHPKQSASDEELQDAINRVNIGIDANMSKVQFSNTWQFRLFVIGGVLFVVWRVTEIIRLAP